MPLLVIVCWIMFATGAETCSDPMSLGEAFMVISNNPPIAQESMVRVWEEGSRGYIARVGVAI